MGAMQKALADNHGSQCGFCSPGFVTTVEAYRAQHPDATAEELETALDGNICRCTGYRSILQAVRSLGKCDGKGGCGCHDKAGTADVEDVCAAKGFGVFRDVEALRALSQVPVKIPFFPPLINKLFHLHQWQTALVIGAARLCST